MVLDWFVYLYCLIVLVERCGGIASIISNGTPSSDIVCNSKQRAQIDFILLTHLFRSKYKCILKMCVLLVVITMESCNVILSGSICMAEIHNHYLKHSVTTFLYANHH